jgi:hypothetical protein
MYVYILGAKPVPKSVNGEKPLYQSRNNCFPLVAFVGKDNETNASFYCGPLFKWAENLGITGYIYKGILYRFKVLFPCDMKAAWQGAGMGGSSGTTNSYCFLCDEKKCNKGFQHIACEDCHNRRSFEKCRHVDFCYGACSPTPIDDHLIKWCKPTYPNPTTANKRLCNDFLSKTNRDHVIISLSDARLRVQNWLSSNRIQLSDGYTII